MLGCRVPAGCVDLALAVNPRGTGIAAGYRRSTRPLAKMHSGAGRSSISAVFLGNPRTSLRRITTKFAVSSPYLLSA